MESDVTTRCIQLCITQLHSQQTQALTTDTSTHHILQTEACVESHHKLEYNSQRAPCLIPDAGEQPAVYTSCICSMQRIVLAFRVQPAVTITEVDRLSAPFCGGIPPLLFVAAETVFAAAPLSAFAAADSRSSVFCCFAPLLTSASSSASRFEGGAAAAVAVPLHLT